MCVCVCVCVCVLRGGGGGGRGRDEHYLKCVSTLLSPIIIKNCLFYQYGIIAIILSFYMICTPIS